MNYNDLYIGMFLILQSTTLIKSYVAGDVLTTDNLTKELLWCVSEKGSAAHQELIQDDSHCPPVHRLAVALTENHLGGDVLWSATNLQKQNVSSAHEKHTQKRILA